jgi:hypothetical protein
MRSKQLFLLVALLLSACAPSQSAIQTSIAQTQTAQPTSTPVPTATPNNAAYLHALQTRMLAWTNAYSNFMSVFVQLKASALVMVDPKWRKDNESAVNQLLILTPPLSEIQPVPPDFETINGYLIKLSEETPPMLESYKLILTGDDTQAEKFKTHYENVILYVNLVSEEINKHTSP